MNEKLKKKIILFSNLSVTSNLDEKKMKNQTKNNNIESDCGVGGGCTGNRKPFKLSSTIVLILIFVFLVSILNLGYAHKIESSECKLFQITFLNF